MPQTIVSGQTDFGQKYEVKIENGIKVLNSEHANYSFGSLHQIMQKGLDVVFKRQKPKSILVLGLGAGSVLSILKNKCDWNYQVTAIEIDSDLIRIAKTHFDLENHQNLKLITGNAELLMPTLEEKKYDLIIDDIFLDDAIPAFCFKKTFLIAVQRTLTDQGTYMKNTMLLEKDQKKKYELKLTEIFAEHYSVKHTQFGNIIYFCHPKMVKP